MLGVRCGRLHEDGASRGVEETLKYLQIVEFLAAFQRAQQDRRVSGDAGDGKRLADAHHVINVRAVDVETHFAPLLRIVRARTPSVTPLSSAYHLPRHSAPHETLRASRAMG